MDGKHPFNLTHFSMDYYHAKSTGRVGKTVWDLFEEFVFPKLGNRTKVLFVPPTFGSQVDARPTFTRKFRKMGVGEHFAVRCLEQQGRPDCRVQPVAFVRQARSQRIGMQLTLRRLR